MDKNSGSDANYVPHLTNQAVSRHPDTIFLANEMNKSYDLSKNLQYYFYLNTIRPLKRYGGKWDKNKRDNDIEMISRYYNYSYSKAMEIIDILSPEQIKEIRDEMTIGVTVNE